MRESRRTIPQIVEKIDQLRCGIMACVADAQLVNPIGMFFEYCNPFDEVNHYYLDR
jgi:hypothetical protein